MNASAEAHRGDRIAKFLSRAGVASRRDAERMLAEGAIRLNGKTVTHPATFITPGDVVQVHGRVVDRPDRTRVWRYHKPDGLQPELSEQQAFIQDDFVAVDRKNLCLVQIQHHP
ncbi:MAG TPA: S4 domain-containing protein, partial [Rhodopila sp.]